MGLKFMVQPHGEEQPSGAKLRQQMLDAGAPTPEVDAWVAGMRQQMMDAGAPAADVGKYWGDRAEPNLDKANAVIGANMSTLSPTVKEKVAENASDAFAAGLQISAAGLSMRGRKPDVTMPEDPTLAMRVTNMLGQAFGDTPAALVGAIGGAAGGTVTMGPGPGTVAGGLLGGAALPATIRHVLMDQYNHPEGVRTFDELWDRASHTTWEIAKETATGFVAGKAGIALGGKVLGATGSQVLGTTAGIAAAVPAATVTGAALEGRVPTADDFYAGAIVALTMAGAGKVSYSAGERAVVKMSKEGERVAANLRDIYANTGIHPDIATALAEMDPVLKQEIMAPRDADGRRATPAFEERARQMGGEPEPYHTYKPTVNRDTEEAANKPQSVDQLIARVEKEKTIVRELQSLEKEQGPLREARDAAVEKFGKTSPEATKAFDALEAHETKIKELNAVLKDHQEARLAEAQSPARQVPDWLANTAEKLFPPTPEQAAKYGFDAAGLEDAAYRNGVTRTALADLGQQFGHDTLNTLVAYRDGVERTRAWIAQGAKFEDLSVDTQRYLMAAEARGVIDRGYIAQAVAAQIGIQDTVGWTPAHGLTHAVETQSPMNWVTNPRWKDVIATRVTEDGHVIPDPSAVATYLQKVGKLLNVRFTIGQPTDAPGSQHRGDYTRTPHQQNFIRREIRNGRRTETVERGVFIPDNTDVLTQRWYGLNNKQVIYHELGHAIDSILREREGYPLASYTDAFLDPALKKELIEASQKFAPKLWKENPQYRSKPFEALADAIALWMYDPTVRKDMPVFSAFYGRRLKPIIDTIEKALPVKRGADGKWEWTETDAGPEAQTGGGNVGGRQPPPPPPPGGVPGPYGPEFFGPGKGPKKVEDQSLAKLGEDELAERINTIVAPEVKSKVLPDWLNPKKLLGTFDMQLTPARSIDKMMDLKPGQVGVEDMMRQTYTSRDTAQYFLRQGTVDPLTRQHTTDASFVASFKAVKEDGGTLLGFQAYRLAKRTVEKAGQGIDTGVDLEVAQRYLMQPGVEKKYARGAAIMREVKDYTINYAIDSGLYSLETGRAMKELNREHIVMRRVIDPEYNPPGYTPGRNSFRPGQPLRRMEGSDRLIIDPMTTDVDNLHTIVAMADRNRAVGDVIGRIEDWRRRQPKQIEDGKDIPFYKVEDDGFGRSGKAGRGEVLDENGRPVPKQYEEGLRPFLAMERFNRHAGPNDFPYFREGKLEIWRATDPNLAKLMRSMFAGDAPEIANLMTKFADLQRQGITTDPSFPLRTLTYGQFTTPIFGEQGSAIPYRDVVKGAMSLWKRDEAFMRWWRNGGAGASILDMNNRYLEKDVNQIFENAGTNNLLYNTVTHPIEAFRQMGRWLDASARLGNYKIGEEGGTDPFKAAMLSRKAYLDYAEPFAVQWVNKWARMVTFMPTGFKDPQQFAQAMKDRPVTTAALGVATLTAPTMMTYALNWLADQDLPEKDRWSNLPQWQRDTAWVLPPINGTRVRIATPPGPGSFLFKTVPERFLDWLAQEDPKAFKEWARDTVKTLWPTVETQVLPPVTPVIGVPIVEHTFNRDALTGRPVVPERMKDATGSMQYLPDTTETAKAVSRLLGPMNTDLTRVDVSPIFLDNYVREWAGTLPYKLLKAIEENSGIKPPHKPKEAADNFFVGSFFARSPGAGAKLDEFYEAMKELKAGRSDLKLALERQDPREIEDAATWRATTSLQATEEALRQQRTAIQAIYRSNMSDAEKQKFTDGIYTMMFLEAKQGVVTIRELRKTAPRR